LPVNTGVRNADASRAVARILRIYLLTAGTATTLFFLWVASPLPLVIDQPLIQNDVPVQSAAIVCLGSGSDHGLPSSSGWQRIRTSVALYREGFAPIVVFSGDSGASRRSEAEIYAEAAGWIGLPPGAARLETRSRTTRDQAVTLGAADLGIPSVGRSSPLLLVTSAFHARRVRLVFQKAGFTSFRVVTSHEVPGSAVGSDDASVGLGGWWISRISQAIVAVREWGALLYYKGHGWI
jgi:uncharacterized SAM-binding protein YcdF (DUF218 family)